MDSVANATRQEKRLNSRNAGKKETKDAMKVLWWSTCKNQEERLSVQWTDQLLHKHMKINFFYIHRQQTIRKQLENDTIHLSCKQFKIPKNTLKKCAGTYMRKPCELLTDKLNFQMRRCNFIKIPVPSAFIYKLNAISIRITEEFFFQVDQIILKFIWK